MVAAVIVGVLLRLAYVATTPFNLRNYDVGGHLQYLSYMSTEWRVPEATLGWEMHQPPLYYAAAAVWTMLQPGSDWMRELQGLAFICSLATLLIGAWIGTELFPRRHQAWLTGLFTLGLAVFPGLILLSSRVNNDVLYAPLCFAAFGLLLWWWRAPKRRRWVALCLVLTAALLTKSNGLLLIGATALCLVANRRVTLQECLKQLFVGMAIIGIGAGWYHALRHEQRFGVQFFVESSANTSPLSRGLFVGNQLSDYVTLPLVQTIEQPYVSPWKDTTFRRNFWSYAYRSAYLGEFHFGDTLRGLSRGILLSGYGVMVLSTVGLAFLLHKRESALFPLAAVLCLQFAGLMGYRLLNPFACNQDFRFIVVATAPLLGLAIVGLEQLPSTARKPALAVYLLHATLCAALIAGIVALGI